MAVLSADLRPPHRGMDPETLDLQYSPSRRVPSLAAVTERFDRVGAEQRSLVVHERVQYGPHPDEWMWYSPATRPDAPLHVFIHGGYWRRLSADDGTLWSVRFRELGAAFASINYSLCPGQPLRELVRQTRSAVRFLVERADRFGHDPSRIHLSGHSAGAHLAALCLTDLDHGIASATFASGIYDLTPLLFTNVNNEIRLDENEARALSPLTQVPRSSVPTVVAIAEDDTEEFRRQSLQWASAWAETPGNLPPVVMQVSNRHHFDLIDDLADPETALGSVVLRHMGLC
ncbi:MAG: hypothetical protein RI958_2120 [Actinomycetota bacterium]